MKKITSATCVALLLLLAASCSKQGNTKPGVPGSDTSGKKYAVKFNLGGDFVQKAGDNRQQAANARTAADTTVYTLYYFVQFHPDHNIIQKSTDPNFGTIVDSLPGGDYHISVFVTTAKQETLNYQTVMDGDTLNVGMPLPGGDFFAKSINLTVVGAVNEPMILDRVVSRVHLTVLDALPLNADHLEIATFRQNPAFDTSDQDGINGWNNRYDYKNNVVSWDAYLGAADRSNLYFTADQLGKKNWNTYLYFFGVPDQRLNLELTVYSTTNTVITKKTVYLVKNEPGHNVELTGNLFTGVPSGGGLQVALPADTSWTSDPQYF